MAGENGSNTSTNNSNSSSSNSGTGTACAACKYQRRKCASDCPLSPYFPADQPKRFANVHRLFGVSNTLRILKHVDPSKRDDTVKAIAYEADTREKDPVHGCLGVIAVLQNQVTKLKEELQAAREQMFLMEHQQAMAAQQQLNTLTFHGRGAFDVEEDAHFLGDPKLSSLPLDFSRYDHGELQLQQQQQQMRRSSVGGYMGMYNNSCYDESPVSHHQMHTTASLDQDPSYHLRSNSNNSSNSYGYHHPESDMKRENYLLGASSHLSDHELRRAGVYLSLRNHQH